MHINHQRGESRLPKFTEYPTSGWECYGVQKALANSARRRHDREISRQARCCNSADLPSIPDRCHRNY